jgi:diguanylate cyclase (GGDEF)-like protein
MTLTVTLVPLVLVVVALALALGAAVRQRHAGRTDVEWITGHHPADPDAAGLPNAPTEVVATPAARAAGPGGSRFERAGEVVVVLGTDGHAYEALLTGPGGAAAGRLPLVREVTADASPASDVAATDEIMGIPNRRRFLQLMRRELIRASRYGRPLSLLAVRIDRFAAVIDDHGTVVADAVLRAMAATIVADLRASDSFGRLDHDTFGICLPETDAPDAAVVAERVVAEVRAVEVPAAGTVVVATASVAACSVAPGDLHDLDRMLADAEAGLDRCRLAGGDQVRSERFAAVGFGPPPSGRGR